MATPISLNGVSYSVPAVGEGGWGTSLSSYLVALSTGVLSKAGGSFTLTADTDFGASFGLKSIYYKSRGTTSTEGVLRLANAEAVSWRNADNSGNASLTYSASNFLEFGGVKIPSISSTDTLTNKTMSGASNTFSAIPYSALVLTGSVVSADISGTISIAKGGTGQATANAALNALLPSQGSNSGKVLSTNGTDSSWISAFTNPMTTTGDLVYSSDGSGTPARLAIGASTTLLGGGTTPAWVQVSNSHVAAAAGIVDTKLATISTAGKVSGTAITSGNMTTSGAFTTTNASGGFLIDSTIDSRHYTDATHAYLTSSGGLVLTSNGSTPAISINTSQAVTLNAFGTAGIVHNSSAGLLTSSLVVNADVSASAAIAGTKIAPQFGTQNITASGTLKLNAAAVNAIEVWDDASGTGSAPFILSKTASGAGNDVMAFFQGGDRAGSAFIMQVNAGQTSLEFVAISDERRKRNINTLVGALDKLKQVRPTTFQMNTVENGPVIAGFIAQELRQVFPEFVQEDDSPEKYLSISQDGLWPYVIAAIKELASEVEHLKKKAAKQ